MLFQYQPYDPLQSKTPSAAMVFFTHKSNDLKQSEDQSSPVNPHPDAITYSGTLPLKPEKMGG